MFNFLFRWTILDADSVFYVIPFIVFCARGSVTLLQYLPRDYYNMS
jgi:hypothetical protein